MTKRIILLAALIGPRPPPGARLRPRRTAASTATAGSTAELKAPADAFAQDVHQQFGLSCKDCHGGNPAQDDADKAKDKTFKGAPKRAQIPEFCASCHSDAAYMRTLQPRASASTSSSQYETSKHGQLLKKGDTKVGGLHGLPRRPRHPDGEVPQVDRPSPGTSPRPAPAATPTRPT